MGADRADVVVDVVPYDPAWPLRFRRTRAQIRQVLPDAVIEHVGSTSVPGLSSKDTIDVAVGVEDVDGALQSSPSTRRSSCSSPPSSRTAAGSTSTGRRRSSAA